MPREYRVYLKDISEAIGSIETYTANLSFEKFAKDKLIQDAVVRNLEIIGEASKHIPDRITKMAPEIEWNKITGLRDILAHEYFGVDIDIVWDILKNNIPKLKNSIAEILSKI